MQFDVKNVGKYNEFILSETNIEITSGLLDKQEARDLGKDLFEAAYELMDEEDFKEFIRWKYKEWELFDKEFGDESTE